MTALSTWWFEAMPRGRAAALRVFVYLFIPIDLFVIRTWVAGHGEVPQELYNPLWLARLLHLPVPTPAMVAAVEILLLVAVLAALTGRWPRLAGYAVFFLYLQWMYIAFSYGKVDHDRIAFLVALAVLPSVGRAGMGDRTPDERAGWALRCVQVAVVMTYLAAVAAKIRFGGIDWVTGATFMRALTRRGTWITEPLLDQPGLVRASQYVVFAFELLSPLLLVRGRIGRATLSAAFLFHLVTFSALQIMFWPHVLCLLAFLPLERVEPRVYARRLWRACSRRLSISRA